MDEQRYKSDLINKAAVYNKLTELLLLFADCCGTLI